MNIILMQFLEIQIVTGNILDRHAGMRMYVYGSWVGVLVNSSAHLCAASNGGAIFRSMYSCHEDCVL